MAVEDSGIPPRGLFKKTRKEKYRSGFSAFRGWGGSIKMNSNKLLKKKWRRESAVEYTYHCFITFVVNR